MESEDPYHLQRFVAAQDAGRTYDHAAAELRAGRKTSHWMWFIFPQIAGLGYSPASQTYAITSLDEARAYLAHPVLGARLIDCANILTGLTGRTAEQIFGEVDALKLRSSVTLFMHAAPERAGLRSGPGPVFRRRTRLRDRESHLNTAPAHNRRPAASGRTRRPPASIVICVTKAAG